VELDQVLARERLVAALSGLFGTVALFLVGIGLYGLVSHSVIRRRKEIGIRIALGARSATVLGQVVGDTLRLAFAGMAVGLPVAWVAGRFVSSELYGIPPYDPASFVTSIVIILALVTMASLLPAKRAAAIDPLVALRQE
jgi:ABC-type antimicrobial peptide transport system permease subunit